MDNVNQSDAIAAEEVFEANHEVMHLYRSQRLQAPGETQPALPHMEAKALAFFARQPGATLSDLALQTGRDKSQLARLMAALRERGLIDGRPDEGDRRNIRMALTEEGVALHRAMQQRARKRARAAVAGLAAAECRELVALLARIRVNLERNEE